MSQQQVSNEEVAKLLQKHSLVSDQVNKQQVEEILKQLNGVIARGVVGEVVEFGCHIGASSLFIRRLLNAAQSSKSFHVYDSFEGLPEKTKEDQSAAGSDFKAGELAVSKKQFLNEFHKANLRPPIVHKGWFNDLTESDVPLKIAFAFLDGDFYDSIRDSLRLVIPRLQPGSVIVIDDYAREALPGVAIAVNERFSKDQIRVTHNLAVIRI